MPRTGPHGSAQAADVPGLSRQELVIATARLIERQGARNLSMRVLAAELGVTATAIYYHVRNKQQLLELTAESIVDQIRVPRPVKDWRDELRLLLLKQQSVLRRYPGIGRFLFDHRGSPAAVKWMNTFLDLLLRAGFEGTGAVAAFGRISSHINPLFLVADVTDEKASGPAQDDVADLVKAHPEAYPAVERLLPYLAPMSFDDVFASGIESLVEGLAADLRAARRERRRGLPQKATSTGP